ncbi:MAG: MBL fold metallo-hydrolase [Chloroflexi bacterium]|nr:MBL fold metallo-hydrolase [Chloroflexota bacterium]
MESSGWPNVLPRPGNTRLRRLQSISSWFQVYQVSEDTFAILEPHHYEETISYLILGDEQAVLLDTGMGIANIRTEVEQLTSLPVIVVNSHSHYDHVGDNCRFTEVWAFDNDREVACIERGRSRAECKRHLSPGSYLDLPSDFDLAAYEIKPSPVTRKLHHLDTIELGRRSLEVHHTPGHSAGSICLLESRDGILFTGDAFYPGMLYAHFIDSDFDTYRHSMEQLLDLFDQVNFLCPAHNEVCVSKETLAKVRDAFEQIAAGQSKFQVEENARVYRFEGFGLMLPFEEAQ